MLKKIKQLLYIFYKILVIFFISVVIISGQNIALALLCSVIILIDYFMWVRGSDSEFFRDKTKIEKDLRKIQKLEIKRKLEELEYDRKN